MSFWKKLTGASDLPGPPSPTDRDRQTEAAIAAQYGLTFSGGQWRFEGAGTDELASELADPRVCYELLQTFQKTQGVHQVCLVFGAPPLLLLKVDEKPCCLKTALEPGSVAEFVRALQQQAKQLTIQQYRGLCLIDLPSL
jgi:hypothetical protein